jgi:hypothetical protein
MNFFHADFFSFVLIVVIPIEADLITLAYRIKEEADGYFHTEELKGIKHFALWPLSQAAQPCFGVNETLNPKWSTHGL